MAAARRALECLRDFVTQPTPQCRASQPVPAQWQRASLVASTRSTRRMILEHLEKLQQARIVLASGSPRRLEILNGILKLCARASPAWLRSAPSQPTCLTICVRCVQGRGAGAVYLRRGSGQIALHPRDVRAGERLGQSQGSMGDATCAARLRAPRRHGHRQRHGGVCGRQDPGEAAGCSGCHGDAQQP